MRILMIEDERDLVHILKQGFAAHGYQLVGAHNGEDGLTMAKDEMVNLVLLDISLPDMDGHQVLERLRLTRPRLPVLMLTARDDLKDKVGALNAGADDYLTKPFAFEELLARVRVLARRSGQTGASRLQAGDLRVDLLAHEVWLGEKPIELSVREFALLEYFMRHPRQVVSRPQILSSIWDYSFDPGSNIVDVYVRHLRRKIDRPGKPSLITTVRGAGYRFDPPDL
ncbi:MAG: response regulator transcription factor [Rubrobacteraceae bacterium]